MTNLTFKKSSCLALCVGVLVGCQDNSKAELDSKNKPTNQSDTHTLTSKKPKLDTQTTVSSTQALTKKVASPTFKKVNPKISYNKEMDTITVVLGDIAFELSLSKEGDTYLTYKLGKEILHNPLDKIPFNYLYGTDREQAMQQIGLFIDSAKSGLLVLPDSTEEFPNFSVVTFNSSGITAITKIQTTSHDCEKIVGIGTDEKGNYQLYHDKGICPSNAPQALTDALKPKMPLLSSQWQGYYNYSTYETDERTGTGVGEDYNIVLAPQYCHIDIVGYQADSHFACYAKPSKTPNQITIFSYLDNNSFGEMRRSNEKGYQLKITYYDEVKDKDEPKATFHHIQKVTKNSGK